MTEHPSAARTRLEVVLAFLAFPFCFVVAVLYTWMDRLIDRVSRL